MKIFKKPYKTRTVIFACLALAFGASIGVTGEMRSEKSVVAAVLGTTSRDTPQNASSVALADDFERQLNLLESTRTVEKVNNLLQAHSWQAATISVARPTVQDAAPVASAPKEPPAPPPLPFQYVGKIVDARGLKIFVSWSDRDFTVTGGEVIDNVYRVDNVDENSISFIYLPLGVRQTLDIASAQ